VLILDTDRPGSTGGRPPFPRALHRAGDVGGGAPSPASRARCAPDADAVAARVHRTQTELFVDVVRRGEIDPRPGVRDLVGDLHAHRVRVAVATTGRRAWVEPLVAHLLGGDAVEVTVCGDDVATLKPDPEAYLLALRRLGVDAAGVVAVEDSGPGPAAARAAGLVTVVVTDPDTAPRRQRRRGRPRGLRPPDPADRRGPR
jgi:HAD superfamily hydrolase (TIGR01509 family)